MTKLDFFSNAIAEVDTLGHSLVLVKFFESGSTGHLKTRIKSLEHLRTVLNGLESGPHLSSTLIMLMKEVAELLRRDIELDMQPQ